jgi:hypothetical protein
MIQTHYAVRAGELYQLRLITSLLADMATSGRACLRTIARFTTKLPTIRGMVRKLRDFLRDEIDHAAKLNDTFVAGLLHDAPVERGDGRID